MRFRRIERGRLVVGPGFATANSWIGRRPVLNCLFVIAEYVKDSSMLDEHCLEGRSMARYLVVQHLKMPLT